MADINQLETIKKGVEVWNKWRAKNTYEKIDLRQADLEGVILDSANLKDADLSGANLRGAYLGEVNFSSSFLINVNLSKAKLIGANLSKTKLNGANLYYANLLVANLKDACLSGANLVGADFTGANLHYANLTGANLNKACLEFANLLETDFDEAILTNCKIFGISVWDLRGKPKHQSSLVITRASEAEITVDDLQVAQFIHLLLKNKNVRNIIDTITSKAVLILGRFTKERKEVLDLIRKELHKHNYVPIIFDFENTENQSILETVMTLAGMARFIIADVTSATMVREELRSIVEKYPSKPIQPILLYGEKEYVTLPEMFRDFRNILKTFIYQDKNDVISELSTEIIQPAEIWLEAKKNQLMSGDKTDREIALEKENEILRVQLQEKLS